MRWILQSRRLVNDSYFLHRVRFASTSSGEDFEEIYNLGKVWSRIPPRPPSRLPPDERPYFISRFKTDPYANKQLMLQSTAFNATFANKDVKDKFPYNIIYYVKWLWSMKYYWWGADTQLPSAEDLTAGCRQIFLTIIEAITTRNMAMLDDKILGNGSTLRAIKASLDNVNDTKLARLKVSSKDFIGRDGLLLNWDGMNKRPEEITRFMHSLTAVQHAADGTPLDFQYCVYTVYMAALLNKKSVYNKVRPLSYSDGEERAVVFMPKSYGYKTPKYVIMKLSVCQMVLNNNPVQFSKDAMIYDFEIMSR